MSLIRKPDQIKVQDTVKCLIYGQGGTGKSTLALSAPKPLYIDFDTSASRLNAAHRVDTVQVSSWQEVQQVLQEDLSAYQSIVVDTVGKMIDFIIVDTCGTKQPRINDWGTINQKFQWFTRAVYSLSKHVIFVAHRDSRKEGDNTIFVPAIREKNYNAIVTEIDLMGYIESKNNQRVITFDFSDRNDGKNTCNLPQFINIPTIVDKDGKATATNNFFEKNILAGFRARLQQQAEITKQYNNTCKAIDEYLEVVADADSANLFLDNVLANKDFKHVGASKEYAKSKIAELAVKLELKFNQTSKQYEAA